MKRIILLSLLIFQLTIKVNNCICQWTAQTLPVNPDIIYCLKFWNQNTGWLSTGNLQTNNIPKILKTTNGGDNWVVIKDSLRMYSFQVLGSLTVYGIVRNVMANESIYRTFDGGNSWDSVSYSTVYGYTGLFFLNKDTGYIGASDSYWGYIFKTTNGGVSLNQLYKHNATSFGEQLTFFKDNITGEYIGYCKAGFFDMFKSTNSGYNWTKITGGLYNSPGSYFFLNKDTGWVSSLQNGGIIQHTTNGGLSWLDQYTSLFQNHYPCEIYFTNYNKGWAGASDGYLVYATTNGGQIWGKQIAPQSRTIGLFFVDSLTGWCYSFQISRTTNGGGVIIGITKDSNNIPGNYKLSQNYPNPFNGRTIIEYSILKKATIGINIYDISGKSVYDMTANNLDAGNYKLTLDFGTMNLPSGIYFCKFIAVNEKGLKQYSETNKLMYVK